MPGNQKPIRSAVQREGAQRYLLISLISFGGTVMLTRIFLFLTGYPKVGRGELHIAHVLWGGLLLFIAAILPLIFSNRSVYTTGALLSGIGVGLFIDEVGKFITMSNNYFFPPAAPIIYAVFLLTVWVYLSLRRTRRWDARAELYRALDGFSEVLDRDLEPVEKRELQARLDRIIQQSDQRDLARLATALDNFLSGSDVEVAPDRVTFVEKGEVYFSGLEKRFLGRNRLRAILFAVMVVIGGLALYHAASPLILHGRVAPLSEVIAANIARGEVRSLAGAYWFLAHLAVQAISGLLALVSAGFLAFRKDHRGIDFAVLSLVLSLTVVGLLSFFVDQFSAALMALIHLLALLLAVYYRRRYVPASLSPNLKA